MPAASRVAAVVVLAHAVAPALAGAALDPAELLDIEMDELARPGALVADRLLEPDPAEPAHPAAGLRTTETVESGIASVSAISAAVIRS